MRYVLKEPPIQINNTINTTISTKENNYLVAVALDSTNHKIDASTIKTTKKVIHILHTYVLNAIYNISYD